MSGGSMRYGSVGLWPFEVGKGVRFSIYSIEPNIPDFWLLSSRHLIHGHLFTSRHWFCWAQRMAAVASVGFTEYSLALPWCLRPLGKAAFLFFPPGRPACCLWESYHCTGTSSARISQQYFRLLFFVSLEGHFLSLLIPFWHPPIRL